MIPGRLRVSVEIQQAAVTRGGTGEELLTWATVVTRRAAMRVRTATEKELGGVQTAGVVRHEIRVRYESALSDMTPKWRLKIGTRIFDIEAVINMSNRNRELLITAIERI